MINHLKLNKYNALCALNMGGYLQCAYTSTTFLWYYQLMNIHELSMYLRIHLKWKAVCREKIEIEFSYNLWWITFYNLSCCSGLVFFSRQSFWFWHHRTALQQPTARTALFYLLFITNKDTQHCVGQVSFLWSTSWH